MNLTNEFQPIRDWAADRGIYEKGDAKTQTLKGVEEMGELAKAVVEENYTEIADAIGDITVVLVSVAKLCGLKYEDCVNSAFKEIANRKGTIQNGTFIKYQPKLQITYSLTDNLPKDIQAKYGISLEDAADIIQMTMQRIEKQQSDANNGRKDY